MTRSRGRHEPDNTLFNLETFYSSKVLTTLSHTARIKLLTTAPHVAISLFKTPLRWRRHTSSRCKYYTPSSTWYRLTRTSSFLPYTLSFHDPEENDAPTASGVLQKRQSSTISLPSRVSALSLLSGQTPPQTPYTAAEEFFAPFAIESQRRHFARPGDPRSLVHSDAEVPAWGKCLSRFKIEGRIIQACEGQR